MANPNPETTSQETAALGAMAGKYLTFALANERYGLQILKVQEIIGMANITRVPRAAECLKGVINLRGKIIPVVDLRLKFGLEEVPPDARTCIIVVEITLEGKSTSVGVIVDTVLEVRAFSAKQLEPAPEYGINLDTSFILGIGRTEDNQVIILVDIERALNDGNLQIVNAQA
jgi:purine-binding chemotaxis protein CheW